MLFPTVWQLVRLGTKHFLFFTGQPVRKSEIVFCFIETSIECSQWKRRHKASQRMLSADECMLMFKVFENSALISPVGLPGTPYRIHVCTICMSYVLYLILMSMTYMRRSTYKYLVLRIPGMFSYLVPSTVLCLYSVWSTYSGSQLCNAYICEMHSTVQEVPEYQLFLSIASTGLVRSKDFTFHGSPLNNAFFASRSKSVLETNVQWTLSILEHGLYLTRRLSICLSPIFFVLLT